MSKALTVVIAITILISGCSSPTKSLFVKECVEGGDKKKTCSCTYEKLVEHYGEDRLRDKDYVIPDYNSRLGAYYSTCYWSPDNNSTVKKYYFF